MEVAFNEADYLQRDDIFSRQAVDRFLEVGEIRSWCSPFLAKEYFMNALVLFDGEYGNTERIARAITDALPPTISVRPERASQVSKLAAQGVDLIIVGGPQQQHSAAGPQPKRGTAILAVRTGRMPVPPGTWKIFAAREEA